VDKGKKVDAWSAVAEVREGDASSSESPVREKMAVMAQRSVKTRTKKHKRIGSTKSRDPRHLAG